MDLEATSGGGAGLRARTGLASAISGIVLLALVALGLGACGSEDSSDEAKSEPDKATALVTERDFDRRNFSNGAEVDNKFYPLPPGTQYIFEGRSNRGLGRLPHRVIFTVTDLTKKINGVTTRVMYDQDVNAGKLLEGELAFHAQDDDGNVWNMGEYPEEYDENGRFEAAPDTWISGVEDARAGVLMRADPRPGTPSYHQGLVPSIEFADRAKVLKTGLKNCVPVGCHDEVLLIDETNPVEPNDGHQLKYYAPGVGNIRAAPGRGGKEREVLVLVEVKRLDAEELAAIRKRALVLDKRAYRSRKAVYGSTPPAIRTAIADGSQTQ